MLLLNRLIPLLTGYYPFWSAFFWFLLFEFSLPPLIAFLRLASVLFLGHLKSRTLDDRFFLSSSFSHLSLSIPPIFALIFVLPHLCSLSHFSHPFSHFPSHIFLTLSPSFSLLVTYIIEVFQKTNVSGLWCMFVTS